MSEKQRIGLCDLDLPGDIWTWEDRSRQMAKGKRLKEN